MGVQPGLADDTVASPTQPTPREVAPVPQVPPDDTPEAPETPDASDEVLTVQKARELRRENQTLRQRALAAEQQLATLQEQLAQATQANQHPPEPPAPEPEPPAPADPSEPPEEPPPATLGDLLVSLAEVTTRLAKERQQAQQQLQQRLLARQVRAGVSAVVQAAARSGCVNPRLLALAVDPTEITYDASGKPANAAQMVTGLRRQYPSLFRAVPVPPAARVSGNSNSNAEMNARMRQLAGR